MRIRIFSHSTQLFTRYLFAAPTLYPSTRHHSHTHTNTKNCCHNYTKCHLQSSQCPPYSSRQQRERELSRAIPFIVFFVRTLKFKPHLRFVNNHRCKHFWREEKRILFFVFLEISAFSYSISVVVIFVFASSILFSENRGSSFSRQKITFLLSF
jgi:hypothetical protein